MSIADEIINGTYSGETKKKKESIAERIINGTYNEMLQQKNQTNDIVAPINTSNIQNTVISPIVNNTTENILKKISMNPLPVENNKSDIKQEKSKNLISGLANSNEVNNATEISFNEIQNRARAEEKNKNIAKGGIDAFNEYADSTLNAVLGGVQSVAAGLGNVVTTTAGAILKGVNSIAKSEKIDELYDTVMKDAKEIDERGNKYSNINNMVENDFTRTSAGVVNTVSSMLATAGIGGVVGVPGKLIQGLYVGGKSAQEVLNENKDKIVSAGITGLAKGYASYLIEGMSDSNILTKGTEKSSIQEGINKLISSKISSEFGQKLADKAVGIVGENIEEFIEDNVDNLIDKLVNNKELPGFEEWLKNTNETIKMTTLSTLVLDLLGFGGSNFEDIKKDSEAQKWINEAEKIIKQENMAIVYDEETQNMINKNNNLENNQETVYNNPNESDGEVNEYSRTENERSSQEGLGNLQEEFARRNSQIQEITRRYKDGIKTARDEIIDFGADEITSKLPVSDTKARDFLKNVIKDDNITKNNIYEFLSKNNTYKNKTINEEVNNIRKAINSVAFKLTDSEINELKYNYDKLPRNIKYDNNNGVSVDQFYEELSSMYPDFFSKDTYNTADRVMQIVEFMKNETAESIDIVDALNEQELNELSDLIVDYKNSFNESKRLLEEIYKKEKSKIAPIKEEIEIQNQAIAPVETNNNQNTPELNNILNNKQIPMQYYQYEKSDNVKIDNLRKDASKYFNNSKQAHDFINMLEKIIADKDIDIRLDDSLTDNKGNFINGKYENGTITINPKSTRAGEFIAIHELTHAIGTKEMLNIINTYRNSNAEFDTAVKNLLKNYEGAEISEEALSDIAGQLFGNQEFINNLAQNNPSIFRKIYNEIKYLWHQFTGYKNQNQFIEDLQYKWEQAYRKNSELNKSNNYSLEDRVSGDKLLNTQDLIDDIKQVGAKVDDNGYVTLYHRTTPESAKQIRKTGKMIAKEDGLFFSTNKDGINNSNYGEAVIELKVPAEILELNDIFDDEASIRIPLNNKNEVLDVSQYIANNEKKVYNIIYKSISNSEKAQVNSEVKTWRQNQPDGIGYIDLSDKGYKSYIYNKQGNEVETLLKVNGSEEFKNFIRKGIEDGTYKKSTNINGWATNAKLEYRNNSNDNDVLSNRRNSETISGIYDTTNREQGENNRTETIKSNSKNESIESQKTGSFIMPLKEYNYQSLRPKPRNGWTIDKIQKQLKSESSTRANTKEFIKYDNIEDLMNNIFYHGSITSHDHLKAGSTLKEEQRTGGYGQEYHTISLSRDKNIASNFSSMGSDGYVVPVLLKKGANIIEMQDIEDSIELEDILPELWDKKIDAVKIGDWNNEEYGEKEIVILNPNAIATIGKGGEYYKNFHKPRFENLSKKEIQDVIKKYVKNYKEDIEYRHNKEKPISDSQYQYELKQYEDRIKQLNNTLLKDNKIEKSDIRYSKSNEEWTNYLNNKFKNIDNKGRKLSKEQQEYFKDSKARDDNGQLETVYHGTNKAGFTEFNRNFNYFTNNKEMAQSYTHGMEMVDTKRLESISDAKSWLKGITDEAYINDTTVYDEYGDKLLIYDSEEELLKNLKRDIQKEFGNTEAGGTYEGYVNIEKPIIVNANGDRWSMIGIDGISIDGVDNIKQFLRDYGASVWSEKGKLRTSTNDIVIAVMDAIEDGKIKADGVIIKDVYDEGGYGSAIPSEAGTDYITFNSNQFKAIDNKKPTSNPDIRYSKVNQNWQGYLEEKFKSPGTRTNLQDISAENNSQNQLAPIEQRNSIEPPIIKNNKLMNPIEISQLTKQDASTTPELSTRNVVRGNKESSFYKNITQTSHAYNDNARKTIANDENVKYYKGITNEQSLQEATKRLDNGGAKEVLNWFGRDTKDATPIDVAEGWILLQRYQETKNYEQMVNVAKKMREIGTKSGQTIQAFNIMNRLTPEGMLKYAQSELEEAYSQMSKNKTQEWIDQNKEKFQLTPNETEFIVKNMEEIQKMNNEGYIEQKIDELKKELEKSDNKKEIKQELSILEHGDLEYLKRVKLAEIQKLMTDKLPSNLGKQIKSWMRIAMLFNPKTQVRNIAGNALIAPVNYFGDLFSSYADKIIAKKTGIRTTGNINIKAILKGMKEGAYQSTMDYKKGINTKDMEGNRFEISEGKSFSDKNIIGRTLNREEALLNYVMDAGDRIFSQASFENSLQNQMKLNHTTEITQDMIDIARSEALQRTWNDNNGYTKFVLNVRKELNKYGVKGYGLGDVLIPFAKTPANLTKAIVDYSPVGVINTLREGINLKNSIENGQYTPQMQHKFVQDLGKATAGTMLYILGYALAKAKITTGEGDDDKDVKNFMKNVLGINNYSININGHSFTYDWAQPLAAPLSIMANIENSTNKENALYEAIIANLDTAGSILLEQSFLQSINDVLTNNEGFVSGLANEILELPARAVPTFMKQIADMTDGTARQTYVKGKPVESAINQIKAKIPGVSKTLAPSVDTLGNEIQKYGGDNSAFNVFLNPANINAENLNEAGKEIYRVYEETGNKTIMPRVAPYSIVSNGETIELSTEQRAEFQKMSGKIVQDSVNSLLKNDMYQKQSEDIKAEILSDIVNYAYNKAQSEIAGTKMSDTYKTVEEFINKGGTADKYYTFKNNIDETSSETKKNSIIKTLTSMNLEDSQKAFLYGKYYSSEDKLNTIVNSKINFNEYLKYCSQNIESDKDSNGKTISNSKKKKTINAINKLNLSIPQKAILIKSEYNAYNDYNNEIVKYVKGLNITYNEKKSILEDLGMTVSNDGTITWKK